MDYQIARNRVIEWARILKLARTPIALRSADLSQQSALVNEFSRKVGDLSAEATQIYLMQDEEGNAVLATSFKVGDFEEFGKWSRLGTVVGIPDSNFLDESLKNLSRNGNELGVKIVLDMDRLVFYSECFQPAQKNIFWAPGSEQLLLDI